MIKHIAAITMAVLLTSPLTVSAEVLSNDSESNALALEDAHLKNAMHFAESQIIRSISSCQMRNRGYQRCTQAAGDKSGQIAKAALDGLSLETPWGMLWSATVNGNNFTISYPFPEDKIGSANRFKDSLNQSRLRFIAGADLKDSVVTINLKMP